MRPRFLVVPVCLAVACGGVEGSPDPGSDAGAVDAPPPPTDARPAPTCDVGGLTAYTPVPAAGLTIRQVLPSDTAAPGETIRDQLQGQLKRHYLMVASDGRPLRGQLFLWMSGSGAEPHNYDAILNVAAAAGYPAISLAYDNETSMNAVCGVRGDPRCDDLQNADCTRMAREEMIYGSGHTDSPCLDVPVADAIEHRVLRLLQYLARTSPGTGAGQFLEDGGTAVDWSKIVVAGWSQGGGHASMIARDHLVARTMFVSKGPDSSLCPAFASMAACDLDGNGVVDMGNLDELMVPAPWASAPRATPGSREFGFVHEREDAWWYVREAFELWGMGDKDAALRIDELGPYPAAYAGYGCAHVISTNLLSNGPSCDPTDFHKSMALDGCLARDAGGVPVLAPAMWYALTVPVP